ncbi:MAG: hypothetical protein K9N47_18270 [Prosthecobacter sp.]|uniref:hypothetical protein n=1 Tax=Prosthecobacter sp. TaxID=1965333 RepID=UPI0025F2DBAE|nr:hypothetical protein [Prosthecobacter sp.]MCF7788074.1 hypothetical protein [Prosthecobacter sp.]
MMQVFLIFGLLLATPAAWPADLPEGKAWTFQNYLKDSKHAILVCEVQLSLKEPAKPGNHYEIHVSATVVRPIKGQGRTGDRLRYFILCEDKPSVAALAPGGLSYLFLDEYVLDEFMLDTGAGWRYEPELDALLTQPSKQPNPK